MALKVRHRFRPALGCVNCGGKMANARFSRGCLAGLIAYSSAQLGHGRYHLLPLASLTEQARLEGGLNLRNYLILGSIAVAPGFTSIVPSNHSQQGERNYTYHFFCISFSEQLSMGLQLSKKKLNLQNIDLELIQSQVVNRLWKNYLRSLVSKKRRRMLVGGYDLDMTYITDGILAMSFPAECMQAMYRNPMWEVKSVLEMRHHDHYKVYNLCIEEAYDATHFHGRVERYPIDDNHVPPLIMIKEFCEDVHSWLSSHPRNIAVVHCMAGKGRTGLMVCCYLVYSGMSAEQALQTYAEKRTTNNEGVSIPSQRRYVKYWEKTLSFTRGVELAPPIVSVPKLCTRELQRIRLYDTVNINQIYVVVSVLQEVPGQRYCPPAEVTKSCCRQIKDHEQCNKPRYYYSFVENDEGKKEVAEPRLVVQMDTESSIIYQKTCLSCHYNEPVKLKGDVQIIFYEKRIGGRLFYVCFNMAFITSSLLQFTIRDLDKVGKRGRSICGESFCLELFFGPSQSNYLMPSSDDKMPAYE